MAPKWLRGVIRFTQVIVIISMASSVAVYAQSYEMAE